MARQLPTHPEQCRHKKLNLVPIQVSANTNIVKGYDNIFGVNVFKGDPLIND